MCQPGVVILDLFKQPDEKRQLPMLATLFFTVTSGGGIYANEIKQWLTSAGFEQYQVLNLSPYRAPRWWWRISRGHRRLSWEN
jgi:uncharacterized caspase-like protein